VASWRLWRDGEEGVSVTSWLRGRVSGELAARACLWRVVGEVRLGCFEIGKLLVCIRGASCGKWGMRAVVVGVILFVILFANHLLPSEGFFGLLFYHCIKLAIRSKLN